MEPDLLGAPYQRQTLDLGRDVEGPVTATLVRRRCDRPTRTAVLYVHGFVDYFFQTHLADFFVGCGLDFYAVDLRKHGRSLLSHQTPNFCQDVEEYYPELDEAVRIIRDTDGHDRVLLNGHSTGGLITALWAHDRRGSDLVDAFFCNSPFFDLNASWVLKELATPLTVQLGRVRPFAKIPFGLNDTYGRTISRHHHGEWDYDLAWKPLSGFPTRAGWLRAMRKAQQRLHAGLDIQVPVLVAASTVSYKPAKWGEDARTADAVLDVGHMAKWAPSLGRCVTLVRVEGGLHDLTLSPEPVRQRLFAETRRWMSAYFPVDRTD